jgi:Tfp pilus assembly pilus retraction ATPase PilT
MAKMTTKQLIDATVRTGQAHAIRDEYGNRVAVVVSYQAYERLKKAGEEALAILNNAKALNEDAIENSMPVMIDILRKDGHDGLADEMAALWEMFKSGNLTEDEVSIRTNSILAGLTNTTDGVYEAKLKTELDPDQFQSPGRY